MDSLDVKTSLGRCRKVIRLENNLKNKICDIDNKISRSYCSKGDEHSVLLQQRLNILVRLENIHIKSEKERLSAQDMIDNYVFDIKCNECLTYYYIDGMEMPDVAFALDYSERYCWKLIQKGIGLICI